MRGFHHGRIEEVAYQESCPQVDNCKRSQVEQEPCSFYKDGYCAADGETSASGNGAQHRRECELNPYFSLGSFENRWSAVHPSECTT